jgi:hypothetical protein
MTRVLGIAILTAVFAGFFWAVAAVDGWRAAVVIWGGSLLITGVIILGVFLATGGVR